MNHLLLLARRLVDRREGRPPVEREGGAGLRHLRLEEAAKLSHCPVHWLLGLRALRHAVECPAVEGEVGVDLHPGVPVVDDLGAGVC
eukprot:3912272-Lingulodinium_polyedra.AAC.1